MRRHGNNVLSVSGKSKCLKGIGHLCALKRDCAVGRKGDKYVAALDCVPGIAITLLNDFE